MQIMTKRISAILLAACLLAVLAFGGVMAWADESGSSSLTVHPTNSTDPAFIADIETANVQVDVYKVATASKNPTYDSYDYTLTEPYSSLEDLMKAALDPDDKTTNWQDFSDKAAEIVFGGGEGVTDSRVKENLPVETAQTGMPDGLYLVIPHGQGIVPKGLDQMIATSAAHTYVFQATTVALPTKNDVNKDGVPTTAGDDGGWVFNVEISLKPEQADSYGSLVINKTVNNFQGTKATFTYHIVGTQPDGAPYDEWAAITATSEGSFSTSLRHIKAGTKVKVSEIYDGSRFTNSGSNNTEITIEADVDGQPFNTNEWPTFTNSGNDRIVDGSGIQNQFTFGADKNWKHVATPESAEIEAPAA